MHKQLSFNDIGKVSPISDGERLYNFVGEIFQWEIQGKPFPKWEELSEPTYDYVEDPYSCGAGCPKCTGNGETHSKGYKSVLSEIQLGAITQQKWEIIANKFKSTD